MRKLVWFLVGTALVIWSGVAWAAHSLIGYGGQMLAANADIVPGSAEVVELASWLAVFGSGVGEWAVIIVWAVVSLIIYAVGFVVTRLISSPHAVLK